MSRRLVDSQAVDRGVVGDRQTGGHALTQVQTLSIQQQDAAQHARVQSLNTRHHGSEDLLQRLPGRQLLEDLAAKLIGCALRMQCALRALLVHHDQPQRQPEHAHQGSHEGQPLYRARVRH